MRRDVGTRIIAALAVAVLLHVLALLYVPIGGRYVIDPQPKISIVLGAPTAAPPVERSMSTEGDDGEDVHAANAPPVGVDVKWPHPHKL